MLTILLVALFSGLSLLALGTMAATWRDHGAALLGLPQALRDCPDVRSYRFTLIDIGPGRPAPVFRPAGFPVPRVQRAA
ncbi:MAG TPA: hypothetical protein PKD92_12835 [Novosphingobium sp.]|nr:hypothetical protein [Novosphingobium sp.]HMP57441.1 hypothetical protein [Novosphingobium sp.]